MELSKEAIEQLKKIYFLCGQSPWLWDVNKSSIFNYTYILDSPHTEHKYIHREYNKIDGLIYKSISHIFVEDLENGTI